MDNSITANGSKHRINFLQIKEKMDEKQLAVIFTSEKLAPLILAILEPQNKRTIYIAEMLAGRVFNKLIDELPKNIVNELSSDIGKTWTYAKIASEFLDKPLIGKNS